MTTQSEGPAQNRNPAPRRPRFARVVAIVVVVALILLSVIPVLLRARPPTPPGPPNTRPVIIAAWEAPRQSKAGCSTLLPRAAPQDAELSRPSSLDGHQGRADN